MYEFDDRELVGRIMDGDRDAIGLLLDRYERPIFNVAYRITNDPEDARDVTQSVFVRVCEKLHTYDSRYKFFSWIYRIAINESLRFIDRRRPHVQVGKDLVDSDARPDEGVARRELCGKVRAAVMALPVDYREIILLRHFGGLSYVDMSGELSIPVKTVKSRLFTARRLLRDKLRSERLEIA